MGPHVKWGSSASPFTRVVGAAAGSDPFAVTSFNATYTDSGLFGFVASSPASIAGKVRFTVLFGDVSGGPLGHICCLNCFCACYLVR